MQTMETLLRIRPTAKASCSVFSSTETTHAVCQPYCVSVLVSQDHDLPSVVLTASVCPSRLLSVVKYYQNRKFCPKCKYFSIQLCGIDSFLSSAISILASGNRGSCVFVQIQRNNIHSSKSHSGEREREREGKKRQIPISGAAFTVRTSGGQ